MELVLILSSRHSLNFVVMIRNQIWICSSSDTSKMFSLLLAISSSFLSCQIHCYYCYFCIFKNVWYCLLKHYIIMCNCILFHTKRCSTQYRFFTIFWTFFCTFPTTHVPVSNLGYYLFRLIFFKFEDEVDRIKQIDYSTLLHFKVFFFLTWYPVR